MSFDPTSYPYDAVVRITATFNGVRFQSSGVLISPDEVLTAAHVVYSSDQGQAANILVTPDYNLGAAPYGTYSGVAVHYNPIQSPNDSISLAASQSDYAVIHLSQPVAAGAGTMGILANYPGGAVQVTGYPSSAGGAIVDSRQTVTPDANYTLFDGADTRPGSSGAPVWVYGADGAPDIVGLVSSGDGTTGYFVQITTAAANQIQSWVSSDEAVLAGTTIRSVLSGSSTGQVFTAGTGNVTIDAAGYRHDTIVLHGAMNQYSAVAGAPGDLVLTDRLIGRDYVVQTTGVEYFQFADRTVVALNGVTQLIAGLYQAALDRPPDVRGLSGWEDVYNDALSPAAHTVGSAVALLSPVAGTDASITAGFVGSPEFQQAFGHLSNAAFITLLYANALHRAPDQPGYDYWQSVLTSGVAGDVGHAEQIVVAGIAASAESLANVAHGWFLVA